LLRMCLVRWTVQTANSDQQRHYFLGHHKLRPTVGPVLNTPTQQGVFMYRDN